MTFVDIKCLESLLIEGNELTIANESINEKLMNIGKKIINVVKSAIKVIISFISKIINVISSKAKNTKASVDAKLQGYTKINSGDLYAVIDVASSFMNTTQSYITHIFITQQKVDITYLANIGSKLRECENKVVNKTKIVEQKYKNKTILHHIKFGCRDILILQQKRLGGINMAKNYNSSNKNSYGEDGYNSTNKNKTSSSMGDKNASNKASNKNAKNSSNKNASNASDRNCHDESDRY